MALISPSHQKAHAFALRCFAHLPAASFQNYQCCANDLLNKLRNTRGLHPWHYDPSSGISLILQIKLEIVVYTWVSNRIICNEKLTALAEERKLEPLWPPEVTEGNEEFDNCMWRAPEEGFRSVLV